jgi:hypothetical protein
MAPKGIFTKIHTAHWVLGQTLRATVGTYHKPNGEYRIKYKSRVRRPSASVSFAHVTEFTSIYRMSVRGGKARSLGLGLSGRRLDVSVCMLLVRLETLNVKTHGPHSAPAVFHPAFRVIAPKRIFLVSVTAHVRNARIAPTYTPPASDSHETACPCTRQPPPARRSSGPRARAWSAP